MVDGHRLPLVFNTISVPFLKRKTVCTRISHMHGMQQLKKKLARFLGCFASEHHFRPLPTLSADEPHYPFLFMRPRVSRHPSFTPKRNNMNKNKNNTRRRCKISAGSTLQSSSFRPFVCLSVCLSVPCQYFPPHTHTLSLLLSVAPSILDLSSFLCVSSLQPELNVGPGGVLVGIELNSIELN